MSFHPLPGQKLLSTENLRYLVHYACDTVDPENPSNDPLHIHSLYEIYVNLDGNVSFLVNDLLLSVKRGSVIVTRPGDVHRCVFHKPCRHEHYCMWIDAPIGSPIVDFMHGANFSHLLFCEADALKEMLRALEVLRNEKEPSLAQSAAFYGVLSCLCSHGEAVDPVSQPLPQEMQEILAYVNANFTELRRVSEICEKWYISPATLNRWFQHYLKISPSAFLESKKLAHAQTMLCTGANITDAAFQSGYSDVSYFISVFKKRFGITPAGYRKRFL